MNQPLPSEENLLPNLDLVEEYATNLTKRELIAAMAMQGSLGGVPGSHLRPDQLARDSVEHADALLKELAK